MLGRLLRLLRVGPVGACLVLLFLPEGNTMAFELTSSAFKAGDTIPRKYTCDGADVSPPLTWADPPAGTAGFALVTDDPDAPVGTWVHWVLYDLPAAAPVLPPRVPAAAQQEDGRRQATNDSRKLGS